MDMVDDDGSLARCTPVGTLACSSHMTPYYPFEVWRSDDKLEAAHESFTGQLAYRLPSTRRISFWEHILDVPSPFNMRSAFPVQCQQAPQHPSVN